MRRNLLLAMVLVLGLLVFNGCEMANNPMEVESTYNGSTELTKNSTTQTYSVSMEIMNENSNGNLVFKFYHENCSFVVQNIKMNNETLPIVNYNLIEPRSISHVVVDASNINEVTSIAYTCTIQDYILDVSYVFGTTATEQVWNFPAYNYEYNLTIDEVGTMSVCAQVVDDEGTLVPVNTISNFVVEINGISVARDIDDNTFIVYLNHL